MGSNALATVYRPLSQFCQNWAISFVSHSVALWSIVATDYCPSQSEGAFGAEKRHSACEFLGRLQGIPPGAGNLSHMQKQAGAWCVYRRTIESGIRIPIGCTIAKSRCPGPGECRNRIRV
jgi:hypothetical protein